LRVDGVISAADGLLVAIFGNEHGRNGVVTDGLSPGSYYGSGGRNGAADKDDPPRTPHGAERGL
jgi:hypothetical protein